MTAREISDRLDAALVKKAGGITLDEYEKSIVLTKAQSLFIDKVIKMYEYGDNIRHILGKLIVSDELNPTDVIFTGDGFVRLPIASDIRQILFEKTNVSIETIPMDYNDIHNILSNPFRKPNEKIAYRVTADNIIDLYTSEVFTKYSYIYCKDPNPIILEALPYNLSIGGLTVPTVPEIPDGSTLRVIELAAALIVREVSRVAPKQQPEKK